MPRLPNVGSDDGQWGQILNDFLSVEHNSDGTLKKGSDIADAQSNASTALTTAQTAQSTVNSKYTKPASGIPEGDLHSDVVAKLNGAGATDATTSSKGVVQLAGDLSGTATNPTVPGLASKADTSTVLLKSNNFSDLNNFATARQNLGLAVGSDVQAWDAELDTWSTKGAPSGTVVGTTDSQTLTNKTLSSPTINSPTGIVKADVGLSNVPNTDATQRSNHTGTQTTSTISDFDAATDARITLQKGAANGIAELDGSGKVPNAQLPTPLVTSVNTYTGAVTLAKSDVGLGNVDNTSDANKPVSTATTTALGGKVAKAGDTMTGSLAISNNGGKTTLALTDTTADVGLTIGGDVNLYRGAANVLQSDDSFRTNGFLRASNTGAGQVQLGGVGPSSEAAIAFGSTGDTNLYRSAANSLKTDDSFEVASTLYSQGSVTVGTGNANAGVTIRSNSWDGLSANVYSDTGSSYNFFYRARGTIGTPTAVQANDYIGSFGFRTHNGTAFASQDAARFSAVATQTTSTTHGGALAFYTAANGTLISAGAAERMRIDQSGYVRLGSSAAISARLTFDAGTTAADGILFGSDTNLYRSAVNTLKTDSIFAVRAAFTNLNGSYGSMLNDPTYNPASDDGNGLFMLAFQNTPTYTSTVNKTVGGTFLGGIYTNPTISSTGGVPTKGLDVNTTISGGATVSLSRMVHVRSPTVTSGTITSNSGLYIDNQKPTNVTTGYGIYFNGTQTSGLDISWNGDTNLYRSAAGVLKTDGNLIMGAAGTVANSVATIDATQTLTNKRITKRVTSTASSATPTPNAGTDDMYILTALAAAAAFAIPSGTPTDGQPLVIRIKDNGTARALSWNAIYRAIGTALPSTTIINKTLYLGFKYNAADTKWDCLAVSQES